jgi:hypothetical protein
MAIKFTLPGPLGSLDSKLTTDNIFNYLGSGRRTAALLKVHTQKDIDYDAYSSLLFSTASDYDSKHISNGRDIILFVGTDVI